MQTSAAVPQPSSQSTFGRIVNVFVAPKKAFADLVESATWGTWVLPWLLVSAAFIGMVVVGGSKVGFDQIARNKIDTLPKIAEQIDQMPPDQRAEVMGKQAMQTKTGSYAQPIVFLIIDLVIAGLMLGTLVLGFGAKLKFKTALAIVMLAGLPAVIKFVLAMISLALGASPEGFIFENPVASNIGFFMPPDNPVLNTALSFIDIFAIWSLLLSALGFSMATKKSFSTVAIVVFAWYAVLAAIVSGFVAIVA